MEEGGCGFIGRGRGRVCGVVGMKEEVVSGG